MAIPVPTMQRLLILFALVEDEHSGKELRDHLRENGFKQSLPGFYQFMQRLVIAGWVDPHSERFTVNVFSWTETHYRITEKGHAIYEEAIAFLCRSFGLKVLT